MRHKATKIRIPLNDLSESEREEIERVRGKFTVVMSDEICLTCGHRARLQHVDKTDGKREIVQECLYCACKHHTHANKEGR